MDNVSAILGADSHFRENTPVCRTDDFHEAMGWKLMEIVALQTMYSCPVLGAGDIFDHWKPSPVLLSWAISKIQNWIVVPGQHDLQNHSMNLFYKSGLAVLEAAGCVDVLKGSFDEHLWFEDQVDNAVSVEGIPWGKQKEFRTQTHHDEGDRWVLLLHHFVYEKEEPFPGAADLGSTADEILERFPRYDLIVTGDHHRPFVVQRNGRLLVNCGSMMRTTADQIDHRPCVWLWDATENVVEPHFFNIDPNAVSQAHLEKKEERDERVQVFVERLNTDVDIALSFRENLARNIAQNNVDKTVAELIWESLEAE